MGDINIGRNSIDGFIQTGIFGSGYNGNKSLNIRKGGLDGRCYNFNGTNQYVDIGDFSTNIVADGKFSISGWIATDILIASNNPQMIGFYIDGNNYFRIRLPISTGSKFDIISYINGNYGGFNYTISNTNFFHFVFIANGTTWKLYINNVEVYNNIHKPDFATLVGIPSNWNIGQSIYSEYFNGKMFDFKFFNKALTASEVSEIYNRSYNHYSGSGTTENFDLSLLYKNTTAWYKMNESSGTTMLDSTSNGNDGTIINGNNDFFGSQSIYKFEYMGNILSNGGMGYWLSATNLDVWTESIAGTSTINQESSDVYTGKNSCRFDIDGSNNIVSIYQERKLNISGKKIKLTISHKFNTSGKQFQFYFIDVSNYKYLQSDGSWKTTTDPGFSAYLRPNSDTYFKIFEVVSDVCLSNNKYAMFISNYSGNNSTSLYLDNIKIQEKV